MSRLEQLTRWADAGPLPPREWIAGGEAAGVLRNRIPLGLGLVATGATFLFAYVGYVIFQDRFPDSFLEIWNRWDTIHYLHIARDGYGSDPARERLIVWPPLYPWLIRGLGPLVGGHLHAGLLIAFASYLGAMVVLYRLVALDFPERIAQRTILYFSIFPTSYFLHAAYTEAPFTLMVVGAFYSARRGKWALAGTLTALAALTRVTWVALLPALLIEYLHQTGFRLRLIRPDVLYLLLGFVGFAVFLAINQAVFGSPLAFLEMARKVNYKEFSAPWVGMNGVIGLAQKSSPSRFITIGVFEVTAGLGALFAALWCVIRMRASYATFMLASWFILGFNSFWLATARYLVPLFPVFVMLALWGERRLVHATLCFVFLMTYTMLMILFVRGWWTY